MTDAERRVWFALRDRRFAGWKFRRQVPFDNYILDFVCFDAKLVIEIDSGHHDERAAYDARRTAHIELHLRAGGNAPSRVRGEGNLSVSRAGR